MRALIELGRLFSTHPLTHNAPLKAWARFVKWQIRSRLQEEVVVPWIAGQCFAVRKGMTGATGNIYVGLHEFPDMMLLLHFLREGDLFLDIGANVGSYTILAAGACRAKTWSFEPDPDTARHLKRNVALNDLDGLVMTYELALGEAERKISFTTGLDTMNRVATAGDKNIRTVCQQRLDALIGEYQPVMIKMDVEGHEEAVLRGAQALLANKCLKVIELETVTPVTDATLTAHAFERAFYEPFSRKLQREANFSSNAVFVRDWEFVRSRLTTANRVKVLGYSV
ncbi:MAG TPA: FkbM family methyltransferase [Xanthobacteraceae bacterium]|nr:FkbM family methyltransferase [Xanthobacteraceae bacterium]